MILLVISPNMIIKSAWALYTVVSEFYRKIMRLQMMDMLRRRSDGRPIGIKIAAGNIERDLEYCVFAQPDFITIDGRGNRRRKL